MKRRRTMEHPAASQAKKNRTSGKHSRTGCGTCKIRRVKCDETKPICVRCQKFGIVCDGYSRGSESSSPRSLSQGPPLVPRMVAPPSIPMSPQAQLWTSDEEQQYFVSFRDQTSFQITPFFDSDAFRLLILQACDVPSIRHGVIAIGALAKTCITIQDNKALDFGQRIANPKLHHKNAIQEYSTAIRLMREAITEGRQDLRTTLLTCLLIISFECFHGNYALADAQIQHGVALIENWRRSQPNASKHPFGFSSPAPDVIDDMLIQIFGGLAIQSFSFSDKRSPEVHLALMYEGQEALQNMPRSFRNLNEARGYLELIVRRMTHWIQGIDATNIAQPQHEDDDEIGGGERLPIPNLPAPYLDSTQIVQGTVGGLSLGVDHALHKSELVQWQSSFEALVQQLPSLADSLGAILLQLGSKASVFLMNTVLTGDSMVQGPITMEMVEITGLSETVDEMLRKRSNTHCTILQGTMRPPQFADLSCRDSAARRESIELLLRWQRREGVSDSLFMGEVVEWVQTIVEEKLDQGQVPGVRREGHAETTTRSEKGEMARPENFLTPEGLAMRDRRKSNGW